MKLPIDRGAASPMASNNSFDECPAVPKAKAVFARSWELNAPNPRCRQVFAMKSKSFGEDRLAFEKAWARFARSWELKRSPCVRAVSAMASKSSGAWTSAAAKAQATLALRGGEVDGVVCEVRHAPSRRRGRRDGVASMTLE